jgi:HK97 family phage portal protein
MKLFSRKAAQATARPALTRPYASLLGSAPAGGGAQGYEAQLRAAYLTNPVAQRAVRMVAEAAGSAPLTASDPALVRLVTMVSGGQSLIETLAAQLLLHGNAYVQILTDEAGAPAELYALRPERVSVEADARGWPYAYRYRAGQQSMLLAAEDGAGKPALVHIRQMHPADDHYGLGCLGAAASAVAAHNAASAWNAALLDNAARPSGALIFDPGEGGMPLSADQYERLKAEMAEGFQGGRNAGRPMLLEGGLKWQAISLSPTEMDFMALKDSAAREIAAAFGVPPMLIGLTGDATYANYREANRAFWRTTVLPVTTKILGAIAQGLSGWFDGAWIRVDQDHLPALAEDRERLWAQVSAADFLTPDEKRAMLGLA